MWNIVLAAFLALHGVVHLLGFVVSWKLTTVEGLPYKTTILAGHVDLGEAGIRAFGLGWLLVTPVFVAAALGLLANQGWWLPLAVGVTALSLAICILDWPWAQFGAYINVVILALLLIGPQVEWLSSRLRF